jgi:hypothetical protein
MTRRLPDDPVKRRLQYFKRAYQHLDHWHALMEDRGMSDVMTTPEGEDIFWGDLMVGLPYLPKRQREAFVLICMQGYTEAAARDELLPNSASSTPVQQYADSGLVRMVDHYDAKQNGFWPPLELIKPTKDKTGRLIVTNTLHPLLKRHLEAARKDIIVQMDGLKVALAQVDEMLGLVAVKQAAPPPAPAAPAEPALPRPEGKPDLNEMAKQLAADNLAATG